MSGGRAPTRYMDSSVSEHGAHRSNPKWLFRFFFALCARRRVLTGILCYNAAR